MREQKKMMMEINGPRRRRDRRRGLRVPSHERADPAGDEKEGECDGGSEEELDLGAAEEISNPPQQRRPAMVNASGGGLLLGRRIEGAAAGGCGNAVPECYDGCHGPPPSMDGRDPIWTRL